MSGALNQAVTLAVQAIVSGTNSRRTEFSSRVGLAVNTSSVFESVSIPTQTTSSFGGATQLFAMMADNPVTVTMVINNVTVVYANTTMLVINCAFTSVSIENLSVTTIANARLAFVS
jgi:hypothetical protein